jgi:hypothetical protein
MNTEHSSARLLEHFRAPKHRLPLHPLEKAVLAVVAAHLCFLPWALGTMHPWSQVTSLVLSAVGMALALIPRTYSGEYFPQLSAFSSQPSAQNPQASGFFASVSRSENRGQTPGRQQPATASFQPSAFRLNPLPRLLKFPIFWLGLMLLAYIALQASNPSWVWERNATHWWLRRVNDIPWLPTSIDTPFERFNVWRQFIIYASAWLTVCTVWTGFTRRKSLQLLLTILIVNTVTLVVLGFVHRLTVPELSTVLWAFDYPGGSVFSTFIYKNHAGAYLALLASLTVAAAIWTRDTGQRSFKKSTPASLLIFCALLMGAGVLASASRGAVITLVSFGVLVMAWYLIRRSRESERLGANPIIATMITLLFLGIAITTFRYADFSEIKGRFEVLSKKRAETFVDRQKAYAAGSEMLADSGMRGIGAGGFRYLFPEYVKKYPSIHQGGRLFWEHIHRDWLEIPIELGAAGTLLLLLGGGYWLLVFLRPKRGPLQTTNNAQLITRASSSPLWHSLAIPVLIGCSQTLAHAWFDFPFQNPAILCTWLALIATSARWLELDAA